METTIYDKELDRFVKKYFVINNEPEFALIKTINTDTEKIVKRVCSLLLYYDSICFEVNRENNLIPFFINLFGENGFEELLETKAIKFLLNTQLILQFVEPIKDVYPLSYGQYATEFAKYPEVSLEKGFEWLIKKYDRKYKRYLSKKILKNFKATPDNICNQIIEQTYKAYNDNLFKELGLPYNKDLKNFNAEDSNKLIKLANYYMDLCLMAKFNYSYLDNIPLQILNNEELKKLKDTKKIFEYTNMINNFENLPNFDLLIGNKIQPKDIPYLRSKKNSIKFRKWISDYSSNNNDFDVKLYLDEIEKQKNFWDTKKCKLTKTSIDFAINCIPNASGLVISTVYSLLDNLFLSNFQKSWSPRFFYKELRDYIECKELENSLHNFK